MKLRRWKDEIITAVLFLLIILFWVIGLSSCSSAWHLKKAIQKGAKVTRDTVIVEVQKDVIIPEVKTDTIFSSLPGDTVTISKERLEIKYVRLPGEKVYIEGECKSDTVTVTVEVPCGQTTEISAGYSLWEIIIFGIWMIPVGWLIVTGIIRLRKRKSPG